MNGNAYDEWIGRSVSTMDIIARPTAEGMAATVNEPPPAETEGAPLPHLWHWLYFLERPRMDELGSDGHVQRGRFLPPVDLPRRMWGGSRLTFHRHLRLGERAKRTSRIADVVEKRGRSGMLVIVTVEHTIQGEEGLALIEMQDVVYREEPKDGEPSTASAQTPEDTPGYAWSQKLTADPVLLFRYSALTFNSHRIHFDEPYATRVEGYPGLVVHGPLIATLLMDGFARRHPDRVIRDATVRAMRPLFHGAPFWLQGTISDIDARAELRCLDENGAMTMNVTLTLES